MSVVIDIYVNYSLRQVPIRNKVGTCQKIGNGKEPLNLPSIFLILNNTKMLVIKMLLKGWLRLSISVTYLGYCYYFKPLKMVTYPNSVDRKVSIGMLSVADLTIKRLGIVNKNKNHIALV